VLPEGRVQESDTSLHWRGCTPCGLGGEAGHGGGTTMKAMQTPKRAALSRRRGKARDTCCFWLQTATCSL
jgi:hypothetical protein